MQRDNTPLQLVLLWALLVLIGLASRSYTPIDETRYVTVAWNMWLNGDYLVPYLNGEAYSHKPPMLFWLINLGWSVFGVNEWWPRVMAASFALACLFLTKRIANKLWPYQPATPSIAMVVLFGASMWTMLTTALMFDMLITCFTLLGMLGVINAYQQPQIPTTWLKSWGLFALAIGGGLLAKGPTILLQLLPTACLVAWWGTEQTIALNARFKSSWFKSLGNATLLGIAIALIWAIPAGIHGGHDYQYAIFWGQTANRMVDSFAHHRPMWWYLPLLPILLFPWSLWGTFWIGLTKQLKQNSQNMGLRFCLAWVLPVFIAFCLISGKQVHYLLPILPGIALLIAYSTQQEKTSTRLQRLSIGCALFAIGIALSALTHHVQSPAMQAWLHAFPSWLTYVLMASAIVLVWLPKVDMLAATKQVMVISVLLVQGLFFYAIQATGNAYDMRPISHELHSLEEQRIPMAHLGPYPGIYNFLGRLHQSPDLVNEATLPAWFETHPEGRVIAYFDRQQAFDAQQASYVQDYQKSRVTILTKAQWQAQSALQR